MKNVQNSQDFITRMNLLLDNQLEPDVKQETLAEINTNPSYRELLSQEQSFRDFIRNHLHRKTVSPSLVQSVKEKIHSSSGS
ncbi:MAG: hypothetical protein ACE5FF_00360 [Saprospiraceae bacterium]